MVTYMVSYMVTKNILEKGGEELTNCAELSLE